MLTSEKDSKENIDDVYATIFDALSIGMQQSRQLPFQNPVHIECRFLDHKRMFAFNRPVEFPELLSKIRDFFRKNDIILFNFASNHQTPLQIQNQDDLNALVNRFDASKSSKCLRLIAVIDESSLKKQGLCSAKHHSWTGVVSYHNDRESPPPGTLPHQQTQKMVLESPSISCPLYTDGIFIPDEDDVTSRDSALSRSPSSLDSFSGSHSNSGTISTQSGASTPVQFRSGTYPKTKSDFRGNLPHELLPPYTYPRHERHQFIRMTGSFSNLSDSITNQIKSKWRKGRLLGSGPVGQVILCYEEESGREVAAKVIEISSQKDGVSKVVKELEYDVQLLKSLHHDRIIQYFGSHDDGQILSIFMEYITGGSVTDQIREYGPLTESVCRSYCRQILEGLVCLHNLEIVHRNIKASNILRDHDGNIKLTDFGIMKRLQLIVTKSSNTAETPKWVGNPHYLAPEVIEGDGYGRKADIWSLGCTIIEMLTGKFPWHELSGEIIISKIVNHSSPFCVPPEGVSESMKSFLLSCFHKNREKRWSAEKLLTHPFVDFETDSEEKKFSAAWTLK